MGPHQCRRLFTGTQAQSRVSQRTFGGSTPTPTPIHRHSSPVKGIPVTSLWVHTNADAYPLALKPGKEPEVSYKSGDEPEVSFKSGEEPRPSHGRSTTLHGQPHRRYINNSNANSDTNGKSMPEGQPHCFSKVNAWRSTALLHHLQCLEIDRITAKNAVQSCPNNLKF